jgi:hypothetical protein
MTMNLAQSRIQDPILTKVLLGYQNQTFVAESLFPRVPVLISGGRVIQFGKEAFQAYNTLRAPGSDTKRITFGYQGIPYALENHALDAVVPREWLRDVAIQPGIDLATRAINLTARVLELELEVQAATLATNAANYDANHKLALAGATKWSASTGTPKTDIDNAREAIRSTTGMYPNVLQLSPVAFNALRNNPNIESRFQYTSAQSITAEMLATLLDIPQVTVGKAVKSDDSGTFTDVWGNNAILAYVPAVAASIEEPSYGYTYTMEWHPLVEKPYWDERSKSWIYGTAYERIPVLTGITSGFLIQNPN